MICSERSWVMLRKPWKTGFETHQTDEMVLVGGSTRIVKIQQLLKECFNGKEPKIGVNQGEAVTFGAAVQGGIISDEGGDA